MGNRSKLSGLRARNFAAGLQPHISAGLTLLAAAPIILVASLVPRAAVLPSLSLAAIAVAALAALAAWLLGARRDANTVTLWDIAGAFVLIGCAAAMLSEPENIVQTFGQRMNP